MIETDTVVGAGMKLTCAREDLVEKLGVVARGVSSRMAVQILSGILLKTEGGELHLAATDMELSLRAALPADVETEGATVVPGRLLLELARLLPESEVTIEHSAEEGSVSVVCGSASYRLHTYDAADFPRLPEAGDSAMSSIDREAFLETVGRVSRSASRDESRPVLTGILVRFEQGKLVMAATDSYRLSVKETSLDSDIGELEAIVPARALNEVARVAQGVDQLQLGMSDNQAIFEADGVVLTTRRIDGQFPNYGQLLPESFEHEVAVPREELLEVVRRISVMAQRNSPLRLSFADGELTVSAQTQDVGSASESLAAAFQGEPLVIGFNAEFLRDGIESVADDELRMKLISPLRPCVLQGAGDDFTYLIMPIRLAG